MKVYTLQWTEADALKDSASAAERSRDFYHLGSAIAWIRRKIRRGEVLWDIAELSITVGDVYAHYEIGQTDCRHWIETIDGAELGLPRKHVVFP